MLKMVGTVLVAASIGIAAPVRTIVTGHVRDEAGAPVPRAEIECLLLATDKRLSATTDENGAFSLDVPPAARVSIRASHPDFGVQWTGGFAVDVPAWTRYYYAGPTPTQPIDLVLRKGV